MFDASPEVLSRILLFLVLIPSVILHEVAHGYLADKLGDPTARLSGRLTLDPRPHIDPWLTLALPFFLLLAGSPVIFGAAKPVPIDSYNFKDPKKDTALTALAGPATNLLIAAILALLLRLLSLGTTDTLPLLSVLLELGLRVNVFLALFNLFPLPPLDGFKVLLGLLPDNTAQELLSLERYGFLIIFAVLFFFPQIIFGVIDPIYRQLLTLLLP